MFGRPADDRHQLFVFERLLDVVERPIVDGANGRLQARLRRHENYDCVRIVRAYGCQNVESGNVGHPHVGDDKLRLQGRYLFETFFPAQGGVGNETFALEKNANGVEDSHLVIDDENRCCRSRGRGHAFSTAATAGDFRAPSFPNFGSITVNRVPAPLLFPSTRMKP